MTSETAIRTARGGRRVIALLTQTIAGPAILVIGLVVAAVAFGEAVLSDPLEDLPTPITVDDAPVLPSDQEPDDGWSPGTRGAVVDAPEADGSDLVDDATDAVDSLIDDVTDTIDDTTDELLDDVSDTVDDITDTVDDTVDDVTDTVDDTVDDVTDTVDDTVDDVTDTEVLVP